jgi:hypothetical protein
MSSFFLKKTRGVTPYCAFIKNKENKLYAKGEKEKKQRRKASMENRLHPWVKILRCCRVHPLEKPSKFLGKNSSACFQWKGDTFKNPAISKFPNTPRHQDYDFHSSYHTDLML